MTEPTLYLIGSLIATGYPIFWSFYKETKFVSKNSLFGYAVASFVFALSWAFNPNMSENIDPFRNWALVIFLGFTVASAITGKMVKKNKEDWKTLPLAGRQVGAFQVAFLIAGIFGIQNKIFEGLEVPSIIDYAIMFLIIFNLISFTIFLKRRNKRK